MTAFSARHGALTSRALLSGKEQAVGMEDINETSGRSGF
jgi:hypothetical protein